MVVQILHYLKAGRNFVIYHVAGKDCKENKNTNDPNETGNGPKIIGTREERNDKGRSWQGHKEEKVNPVNGCLSEVDERKVASQGMSSRRVHHIHARQNHCRWDRKQVSQPIAKQA